MYLKVLLCCSLLLLIHAEYYTIDSNLQVTRVPDLLASFLTPEELETVATVQFIDDRNASGWTYFTVETSASVPDWFQLYATGYLEGYIAYELIWDNWNNEQIVYLSNVPPGTIDWINNQTSWMIQMTQANPNDSYWNLVNATLAQLFGMYQGYLTAISANNRPDLNLTFDQFYVPTYIFDMFDVLSKFSGVVRDVPHCSFLLKLTSEDLFVSHTTWSNYVGLLKTYKVLNLNLQNPLVKTKRMSFSSVPGGISSQDDFYILDNNRFVSETTLEAHTIDVFDYLHYDSIPYWARVQVANLAYDTQENWASNYFAYRSGTYNNQWLVVDFNNYYAAKDNISNASNIIWFIEEFYNLTSSIDVTQELLVPQGYVASYNIPYNQSIQQLSESPTNYTNATRALLFDKYAPGIQNWDDFLYVMRLNNHSDTGVYCEAIAARCDLDPNPDMFGAIDCKATSDSMVPNHQAWIIVGPTYENLPFFDWDSFGNLTGDGNSTAGMPDLYNFPWEYIDPATNFSSTFGNGESHWYKSIWQ